VIKRVLGGLLAIGVFVLYDPKFPTSALYEDEFLVSLFELVKINIILLIL